MKSRQYKIVIFSRHKDDSLYLRTTLLESGFSITSINKSVTKAAETILKEDPDLIIMDTDQGKLDGIAAVREIQAEKILPVIYYSPGFIQKTFNQALKTFFFAYLIKPVSRRDLINAVKTALSGRSRILEMTNREQKIGKELPFQGNREELLSLVETIPYGIQEIDCKGNITYANPAHHRMYGCKEGELQGKSIFDFPETAVSKKELKSIINKIIKENPTPSTYTGRSRTKKGKIIDLKVDWNYKLNSCGEVTGIISVLTDITKQKQTEKEKEKILHALGERIKELNCLYSISTMLETKNDPEILFPEILKILIKSWQYPDITCSKLTFDKREYKSPNYKRSKWFQKADIKVQGKRRGSIEVRYLREAPLEDEGPFLKEERDLINAVAQRLGKALEQKITGEKINKSEERFRFLYDEAPIAYVTVNRAGRIKEANRRMGELLGICHKDLSGKNILQFFPETKKGKGKARNALSRLKSGTPSLQEELQMKKNNGGIIQISLSIRPIINSSGVVSEGFIAITDITEQKKYSLELFRELSINRAVSNISGMILEHSLSIKDIADIILKHSMELTGSEHGYVSEIDTGTGELVSHTLTQMIEAQCGMDRKDQRVAFPVNSDGTYSGLWGHSLNSKEAFYSNSPGDHISSKGIPPGHIPIKKFISVPAIFSEQVVGQISLANPGRDYTDSDLFALKRIADLYALAINRLRNEKQIIDNLKEKDILIKEVHHRVKNNLQLITSLLRLQAGYIQDSKAQELFQESLNRIFSIALLHEKLYHSEEMSWIDFKNYITGLVRELLSTYSTSQSKIETNFDFEDIPVAIDIGISCGLIVNELVSNSIKHAFPPEEGKEWLISLSFKRVNSGLELTIMDNGRGIPADLDIAESESLGLKVVHLLARKLPGGSIELIRDKGTKYIFSFKEA